MKKYIDHNLNLDLYPNLFENFYFVSYQKERDERSHNSCIFSISGNKIELGNRVEVKIVSVEIERKRIGLELIKVI